MSRAVVLVAPILVAWPVFAQGTCPRPSRSAPHASVVVLLIGHPDPPPHSNLDVLRAVDDDVVQMRELLQVLQPARIIMHVRPDADVRLRSEETFLPPTLEALRPSVAELAQILESLPHPREAYVYYAGHGTSAHAGDRRNTTLYLEPSARADRRTSPGHDGRMTSALFAEEIYEPLQAHADTVHLIIDACDSFHLTSLRGPGLRLRTPRAYPDANARVLGEFAGQYPRVGGLFATDGAGDTPERSRYGGVFSTAVRSAASGLADLDHDGVVTYREMYRSVSHIVATLTATTGSARPAFVAPHGADDHAFIDYRGRDVTQLCSPVAASDHVYDVVGLHPRPLVLVDGEGDWPLAIYLERGRTFRLRAQDRSTEIITGDDLVIDATLFSSSAQPTETVRGARAAAPARKPYGPRAYAQLEQDRPIVVPPDAEPTLFYQVGFGPVLHLIVDGPASIGLTTGLALTNRLGVGPHQGSLSLETARSPYVRDDAPGRGVYPSQNDFHSVAGSYAYIWSFELLELGVGPTAGIGLFYQYGPRLNSTAFLTGAVSIDVYIPLPRDDLSVRVGGQGGMMGFLRRLDDRAPIEVVWYPSFGASLAIEWQVTRP